MGIPDHLNCLLRNLYAGQEQKLESNMEQQTGSKLGKECIKVVYCHPAYLSYIQGTSCKIPQAGWITNWNPDCQEKCQQLQIYRWYHPNGRKWGGTKEPLDDSERGEWKSLLKTHHSKKLRSWQIDAGKVETVIDIFFGSKNDCGWWLQPQN